MTSAKGFSKILVAVDGSEVSLRAAERAAWIAKQDGAQLVALTIVRVPMADLPGGLAGYYESARSEAKKWSNEVRAVAAQCGVGVKTEVVVGAYSVVDAILGYAEASGVDLIVSGTRGMTPSRRMLVGSVAGGLVEYASCAVLVVR
ncbi:MAG: universal stress protein [Nitrososphaerota archaeon]|nr:universal stress protein [Nitrososphaerota archaeon]MDG6967449.1 universal stress protein [Nitrososphaerota archaeon]MDG6978387.1 universal stress protein [Nitrososphaerota archaeon]MDG7022863.1 universal stress protein [Nitrososphaerota archaeon]